MRPEKILALQFKYFGDAVLMTPALRAIRDHFPNGELHLLVPEEIAPLFQHLPWLDRVWPMPRRRGSASLGQTWPVVRALRRERFDRSVDFASNDRGAILSFLIGARRRLGWAQRGGFFGRRFCYNQRVVLENKLEARVGADDESAFRVGHRARPARTGDSKRPGAGRGGGKIVAGTRRALSHGFEPAESPMAGPALGGIL